MRITRDTLIRIAKETAQKRALSDPGLVAAYLTGSLRTDNPFLGGATDIDVVMVHSEAPKERREIVPLTPEISIDIVHNARSDYDKPKELRVHPWLGPELYDPQPLYVTQHFFEFVQAGVRAEYDEPANVLTRARRMARSARELWSGLQLSQETGPALLLAYLKAVYHAANAVALLNGGPLAERRFLLQFPGRAEAAGVPELAADLTGLLGGDRAGDADLSMVLPEWEKAFLDAAGRPRVDERIAAPRLAYYKLAFDAMLAGESPQSILWPLVHTWTLAAAVLPATRQTKWLAFCEAFGLAGSGLEQKNEQLDHFLDKIDDLLDTQSSAMGI